MTPPSLSLIAAAIADGRRDFDIWNAPGELSLAALVGSAEQDPRRSLRELLAESLEASSPSDAALDTFSLRRLAMRAKRYARRGDHRGILRGPRGGPRDRPPGFAGTASGPGAPHRKHPPMGTKMGRPGGPSRGPVGRAAERALIPNRRAQVLGHRDERLGTTENKQADAAQARDGTERDQVEAALRRSEIQLLAITESALNAIVMMDPDGRVCYWNSAAERMLGYSSADAMGQDLHGLFAPTRYHAAARTGSSRRPTRPCTAPRQPAGSFALQARPPRRARPPRGSKEPSRF